MPMATKVKARADLATQARISGDYDSAERHLAVAYALAESPGELLTIRQVHSYLLLYQGREHDAIALASANTVAADGPIERAKTLATRGSILCSVEEWPAASIDLRQAFPALRGYYRWTCVNNWLMTWIERPDLPADVDRLQGLLGESAPDSKPWTMATVSWTKGGIAWRRGDYARATALYGQSFAGFQKSRDWLQSVGVLLDLARLRMEQGDAQDAVVAIGMAWNSIRLCSPKARRAFVHLQREIALGELTAASIRKARRFTRF